MYIILMGPPGAGKGTQATKLAKKFSVPHISTGDMFRTAISEKTLLGKEAKSYMNIGKLVPNIVTIGIIHNRLIKLDCKNGFILDGFPRTLDQADALDEILNEMKIRLNKIINIIISENEIKDRMIGRRVCNGCGIISHIKFNLSVKTEKCDKCGHEICKRFDDNEDIFQKRYNVYQEQTMPLINYYKAKGLYMEVDGTQAIEDVFSNILKCITSEHI